MSAAIKFASAPENIIIVEEFIEGVRVEVNIKDSVYEDVFLALIEASTNAMRHGNKGNVEKNVEILCNLDERCEILSLIVKDEGPGFDFNNVPDPTAEENLERSHGRGVFLMKELAQAIFFSDKGATVDMQFSL